MLPAAAGSVTRGRRSCYSRPRVDDIVKDFWNPQCCFPIIKVLFGIKQYIYVGCSKSKKIKVCKEAPAPLKGRVFKIETFNISSSALAAENCAGPHNRLLRRQHCSSLCSQSEGHEHVANIASALGHIFVGFLAVFGRHNIRPPHFASKVSYSASPQTFAECSRSASCCYAAMLFGSKPRRYYSVF